MINGFSPIREADKAYEEFVDRVPKYISKDDYLIWLQKYEWLYDMLSNNIPSYPYGVTQPFDHFYEELTYLSSHFKFENEAKKALEEIDAIDTGNKHEVIKWKGKYYYLYRSLMLLMVDYFDHPEKKEYQGLVHTKNVFFKCSDFDLLEQFYDRYHLLKKE